MSVAKLMRLFAPVEQTRTPDHDWAAEIAWLAAHHPRRMTRLRESIRREGIIEPIRLCYGHPDCGDQLHVVDGHHRLVLAHELGHRRVPVGDAWEAGSDWMYAMDDNLHDDPE
jgi:hypothetical protein